MVSMADSLVNSASRPLRMRKRPDLEVSRHRYHGKSYWVVKEPVGLNYFRFHEEEYAILQSLDGETSLQDIKDNFQKNFAPQRITLQDLQQFIGMLHRSGLVISTLSGQGRQLRRRGDEKKKKERLGKLANIFALRFRGIDPERLLTRMIPFTGWLFSPVTLVFVLMFALSALMLVFVQFEKFQSRLPTFEQFFQADNWIYLGVTMALVKVLHEFGHGLSCKKFGGECHEMGFMFLVFTPCLYCNVSDSWMLPNKWHRVFIGAAGMYVEVILASIATYLWWFSEPGMLNFLCLSVMFICSVSTIMFNGNPLLRFDGYYILMDILEIPNLRQKSTETLKRWFQQTCLGLKLQDNPFLPEKNKFWFALYTVAAVLYRWVVVFSIVIFLNKVLEPYGLQAIGRLIAIVGFGGLIGQPLWQTIKFFRTPGRASKMKRSRVLTTTAVVAAIIALIAFVPLPFHVNAAVEIQPRDAHLVYSRVPGYVVTWYKKPGDKVVAGEPIALFENLDLKLEQVNYRSELKIADVRLRMLERQRFDDVTVSGQIAAQREAWNAAKDMAEKIDERVGMLTVVAEVDGIIIPPPSKSAPKASGVETQLPGWSGDPFSPKNMGAYFSESDLLCIIGQPDQMEAVMVVDQSDIDLIETGFSVDIKLDSARLETFSGKIDQISQFDLKVSPASLSIQAGGRLDTKMDSSGQMRPISTSYQARVPLENVEVPLRAGYRGEGKVYAGWRTLGWRFYRFVVKTFHFEL